MKTVSAEPLWTVRIISSGRDRIKVVKAFRAATACGLKEAVDLVSQPSGAVLIDRVSHPTAFGLKTALERLGATLSIDMMK